MNSMCSDKYYTETVTEVRRLSPYLMFVRVTRPVSFRFEAGQFIMVGGIFLDKLTLRAYSLTNPPFSEYLEFLCRIIPGGRMSGYLDPIKKGDSLIVSKKPAGTLISRDLRLGSRLWLLATGTGIAPFLSLLATPDLYAKFDKITLWHSVRQPEDLVLKSEECLKSLSPFSAENIHKLGYRALVTRANEPDPRITTLLNNSCFTDSDRFMICGSPPFNTDALKILKDKGFEVSKAIGLQGDILVERAFVEH